MTKDEIEKLAVEAGWPLLTLQMLAGTEDEKRLERFAALVAKAEREACAKVAKAISDKYAFGYYGNEVDTADEIESAIRARGNA